MNSLQIKVQFYKSLPARSFGNLKCYDIEYNSVIIVKMGIFNI